MIKYNPLAILTTATTLVAQSDFKERLVEFIQSPPPIREMVVECNWYAHAIGKTNTNWIALCWQTKAYILRNSKERAGLYDTFDTNRDELITVRAGNTYSTVSYYKYEYGGTVQPPWFPHEIVRDAFIGDQKIYRCRFVTHRLELGVVPPAEFYPDRFLPGVTRRPLPR